MRSVSICESLNDLLNEDSVVISFSDKSANDSLWTLDRDAVRHSLAQKAYKDKLSTFWLIVVSTSSRLKVG